MHARRQADNELYAGRGAGFGAAAGDEVNCG